MQHRLAVRGPSEQKNEVDVRERGMAEGLSPADVVHTEEVCVQGR